MGGKLLLAGKSICKVRQMYNVNGKVINEAFPSDPVQVIGWQSLPAPGDEMYEMKNEKEAKRIIASLASQAPKQEKVVQPREKPADWLEVAKYTKSEFRREGKKRSEERRKLRREQGSTVKKPDEY